MSWRSAFPWPFPGLSGPFMCIMVLLLHDWATQPLVLLPKISSNCNLTVFNDNVVDPCWTECDSRKCTKLETCTSVKNAPAIYFHTGFIWQINRTDFSSLNVLAVAFNAVFTLSMFSFHGQLLEQLNVASLSHPMVLLQCNSLLNDDDDDDFLWLSRANAWFHDFSGLEKALFIFSQHYWCVKVNRYRSVYLQWSSVCLGLAVRTHFIEQVSYTPDRHSRVVNDKTQ